MTYVITEPCIDVKDGSCVDVCPVDCIHPAEGEADYAQHRQLYINPEECIDCGACEPACPVTAIFEESAVPDQWRGLTSRSTPITLPQNADARSRGIGSSQTTALHQRVDTAEAKVVHSWGSQHAYCHTQDSAL